MGKQEISAVPKITKYEFSHKKNSYLQKITAL